jgi:hypothetical protein
MGISSHAQMPFDRARNPNTDRDKSSPLWDGQAVIRFNVIKIDEGKIFRKQLNQVFDM